MPSDATRVEVRFHDPDFLYEHDLPPALEDRLRGLAKFGEYFALDLSIHEDGQVSGVFVKW